MCWRDSVSTVSTCISSLTRSAAGHESASSSSPADWSCQATCDAQWLLRSSHCSIGACELWPMQPAAALLSNRDGKPYAPADRPRRRRHHQTTRRRTKTVLALAFGASILVVARALATERSNFGGIRRRRNGSGSFGVLFRLVGLHAV